MYHREEHRECRFGRSRLAIASRKMSEGTSALLVSVLCLGFATADAEATDVRADITPIAKLPFSFIENGGQWDPDTRYLAQARGMTIHVRDESVVLQLRRPASDGLLAGRLGIELVFEGTAGASWIEPGASRGGTHSYFRDGCEARAVGSYADLVYRDMYDGVDVRLRECQGSLEYDLLLAPGSDLEQVVVRCDGTLGYEIGGDGSLSLLTALGPILQPPPATWYELDDGERRPVICRYRSIDGHRFGFDVPERDDGLALVIDPVIHWSTYVGGTGDEAVHGLAEDSEGRIIVAGYTNAVDLDTTIGVVQPDLSGDYDAFVCALSPDGSDLVWSTYLGGSARDAAFSLSLDDADRAYITGMTYSADFPTTPGALAPTYGGGEIDAFVTCLGDEGTTLVYSTFLGAEAEDWATELVLDGSEAIVVGITGSSAYPTTDGAYDRTLGGSRDYFITHLEADGSDLVWSTLLGGSSAEGLFADPADPPDAQPWYQTIAVDPTGALVLGGMTFSADFPTTSGAYDVTHNGDYDAVVCRLDPTGSDLLYSTFMGGSSRDVFTTVTVDDLGRIAVGGFTRSAAFPTTPGAFEDTFMANDDAIVCLLAPQGGGASDLLYSTLIGGGLWEAVYDLMFDASGDIIAAGFSSSTGFPTTPGAFDTTPNGREEGVLFRIRPEGNGSDDLRYSTYIGGSRRDYIHRLLRDSAGRLVLGGGAQADFPITDGAYDMEFAEHTDIEWKDGFVMRHFGELIDVGSPTTPNMPASVTLGAIQPNPVADEFTYTVELSERSTVRVSVFDVMGREIRTLIERELDAGTHRFDGNLATDGRGQPLVNGVYYVRLEASGQSESRRIALKR